MRAIGLMSGTSLDAIDVAMIETDGEYALRRVAFNSYPYDAAMRAQLVRAIADARVLRDRAARPGCLAAVEQAVTTRHAQALASFFAEHGIKAGDVDLIGFHGQTVLHRPELGLTVQLGDGAQLAEAVGIPVVYDLRANDMEHGGQGAPLAPVYHRALAAGVNAHPIAFLNLGGIANVTWIARDGRLLAFDTGPANALLDDWMLARAGTACDRDGAMAAKGEINQEALRRLLSHPYFAELPPKSLDRNAFDLQPVEGLSVADGAATLTAFTAETVARSRSFMAESPGLWVVCGGGRRNASLMAMLAERVDGAVAPVEAISANGDAIEAEAWAYLAVRSQKGLPITFPGTTGSATPLTGGVLSQPPA